MTSALTAFLTFWDPVSGLGGRDFGERGLGSVIQSTLVGEENKDRERKRQYPVPHFKSAPRSAIKSKPRLSQKGPSLHLLRGILGEPAGRGLSHRDVCPRRSVKRLEISSEDPEEPDHRTPAVRGASRSMFADTPDFVPDATVNGHAPVNGHADHSPSMSVRSSTTTRSPPWIWGWGRTHSHRAPPRKPRLTLSSSDYYTVPSIEELARLSLPGAQEGGQL